MHETGAAQLRDAAVQPRCRGCLASQPHYLSPIHAPYFAYLQIHDVSPGGSPRTGGPPASSCQRKPHSFQPLISKDHPLRRPNTFLSSPPSVQLVGEAGSIYFSCLWNISNINNFHLFFSKCQISFLAAKHNSVSLFNPNSPDLQVQSFLSTHGPTKCLFILLASHGCPLPGVSKLCPALSPTSQ